MKSKTFKGKDEADCHGQLWEWRSAYPKAVVVKEYAIEALIPDMRQPAGKFTKKLVGADLVSLRIDYKD